MDEPVLGPRSDRDGSRSRTSSRELVADYTIIIVTHNMQQAGRVSDRTAFFTAEVEENGTRYGTLVEMDDTSKIFTNPQRLAH